MMLVLYFLFSYSRFVNNKISGTLWIIYKFMLNRCFISKLYGLTF